MKFEIIGVFVNTLTADEKHPVPECENLQFLIQMQLSEKHKDFSQFFFPLMESESSFKQVFKKEIVIANVFLNIQTFKYFVGPLSKKRCFRTSFNSQHVKESQTLVKSA